MLLNDPVTLLLIIIPFGLMTTLMLCLSYVGSSGHRAPLHGWIAGDLVLAAYRATDLLQPGVLPPAFGWLGILQPETAFIVSTAGLLLAIGCHTLALHQLADTPRPRRWQTGVLAIPLLIYGLGAGVLLHSAYLQAWFFLFCVITIGLQCSVTWPLRKRFRGAWALLAGHAAVLIFHACNALTSAIDPPGPVNFDEPDMFSLPALAMDFMVSFLFTLSFALMLQEQLRQQVVRLSITDTLTGALNRRGAVSTILQQERRQGAAQRYPLAVAMVDLDNFKRINDQHGHAVGDLALQVFARTVTGLMRKGDVFVRWGGEEFLLVFPGTDVQQAQGFMKRLRDALEQLPSSGDLPFRIGFSAGLVQTSSMDRREDFETLLRAVDKALYRAKQVRGRVEVVEAMDL
ncbi:MULTISPECIES: GGDEF domain-containing protein [unclassified Pseudomonas]|uniref:GGDEF domain-containing protein n=1 Tax=unclassified Pseudomonas TaxID=196821 RepID=UPI000D3650D7|nr:MULTISPECIES: GGDEF domain-containing protein [unclassified Pseudomonas]RAU45398.1 GGDEF domain-containing protein [Pseudomonas sp. RIT 409]RAU53218.1 GGDEF domain-containing protein [Pseudomonas sp. RIT 412]